MPTSRSRWGRYYWGLSFFVAWSVNTPWGHFSAASLDAAVFWPFVALFTVGVLGNGATHLQLRRARPKRYTHYPTGVLFSLVSCPHYTFEVLTWLSFTGASQTYAAALFALATLVTLAFYSKERHDKYREFFDGKAHALYPGHRKALVPFVF